MNEHYILCHIEITDFENEVNIIIDVKIKITFSLCILFIYPHKDNKDKLHLKIRYYFISLKFIKMKSSKVISLQQNSYFLDCCILFYMIF